MGVYLLAIKKKSNTIHTVDFSLASSLSHSISAWLTLRQKVHFRNLQNHSALEKIQTLGLCRLGMREVSVQFTTVPAKGPQRGCSLCHREISCITFELHFHHASYPLAPCSARCRILLLGELLAWEIAWEASPLARPAPPSLTSWIQFYLACQSSSSFSLLFLFFRFRATQYTCMLLRYLLEPKPDKEKVVMKLKKLESSVSTGRKCKYPVSPGPVGPGLDPRAL